MRLRPQAPIENPSDDDCTERASLGVRLHIDVTIPRTTIKARLRLVSRAEALTIKSEAWREFKASSLAAQESVNPLTVADWNMEIAVRHLALAIRDPEDVSRALAPIDDWRDCDDDQIAALWEQYQDFRDQQDPLAADAAPLTEQEVTEMRDLAKKKGALEMLTSCGSRKLALFAITLVDQRAS